jgi:hypothetical protein
LGAKSTITLSSIFLFPREYFEETTFVNPVDQFACMVGGARRLPVMRRWPAMRAWESTFFSIARIACLTGV